MPYLFPEEELDTDIKPSQPTGEGDYLFDEDQPETRPPAQQPSLRRTPQDSPQLFPPGQDHVAREVLGLEAKPYQRSDVLPESHFNILGDFGSGLASGILQTGETAMRAARTFDPPGGIDFIRDATTAGIERIQKWEEDYPRIFKISQEAQDSVVRRAIYGGVQGWIPSIAFGALGAGAVAAAGITGPLGLMLGFGLGAGGMFGAAEYDQFMEDAEANGISRDDAFPYALSSALVEGGGEAIADMLAFKLLAPAGIAMAPFKGSVKQMLKTALRPLVTGVLKQMPVEVGTEMVQGGSQTFLRNLAGMDAGDPIKSAIESIGPAMVMTMLFGASGGVKSSIHMRRARKVLEDGNADPTARQNAADIVEAGISKVDKDLAELWKFNTRQYIEAGYDIPIDRKTSEYLSWGEFSNYSPEMAQGLLDNKDIKLLPEGQGFVLVGEAYDPDEKGEYDMYSPEQAEALLQAKETKLLPDGQGFTMAGDATVYSPQLAKKLKAEKEKKLLEAPTRRAEAPEAPAVVPVPPVEAAARAVEAAIEIGRPEDIAQAERRLERRVKREGLADRTPALVRSAIKAKPDATIGEIYRSVKAQVPEATRQRIAKLVRQETVTEIPTTQKALTIALKDLGQEEFNHQYNPLNVEARMVKELTDRGLSREEAKAEIRPVIEKYTLNYRAVNEKAIQARGRAKVIKEEAAKRVKEAAEAIKKKKAEPKPKKKKLEAKPKKKPTLVQEKKEVKPTKFKAPVSEAVAAMAKPVTKVVKKGTEAAREREKARKEVLAAREEEIKPSRIAIGTEVSTPDGKGRVLHSPQPKQWAVRMDEGWAKGDTLIFAESELTVKGEKPVVKAKLGRVDVKIRKVLQLTKRDGGATINMVTGKDHAKTKNYAIGVFPGETVKIKDLTEESLVKFVKDNKTELSSSQFNLGTWVDDDGVTHIDISVVEPELWKAIVLAKEFGQEFIYDLKEEGDMLTKGRKRVDPKLASVIFARKGQGTISKRASRLTAIKNRLLELQEDKPIKLVRYMRSKVNIHAGTIIGSVDPSNKKHRTGVPAAERDRLRGDIETPTRVHYYEEGGAVEPDVAKLPYKYRTEIPRSKLYDTLSDPLNLREAAKAKGQAKADPNVAERMMRDAGYWGYQTPTGPFPSTVVIFEQLPVYQVSKVAGEARARSAKSIAKEVESRREESYKKIIRASFPTATGITPKKFLFDVFTVTLPNGSKIEVKFNAMPENLDVMEFQALHDRDITGEIPLALWEPSADVTITGEGVIWLAGLGDLQTDLDHETFHAAKSIVLNQTDEAALDVAYPGELETAEERQAEAYEKWVKTDRSHEIFDKIRSFFRRITETFGLGYKGKVYQVFRTIENGKVWERPIGKVSNRGKLYDSMTSLLKEIPRHKKVKDQAVEASVEIDRTHWENFGAVLYIEGLSGKAWSEEMSIHLKKHYGLDTLPRGVLKSIREDSQHLFKKRATETLFGKLPTLEALVEMEKRGAKEGALVWYDVHDGLSMIVNTEDGETIARSARSELEEYFGEDAELMAGLIAHLSSGLQVPVNMTKAIEVYIANKMGIGFKGTYQVTRAQIDEFLDTGKTSGPKRVPFLAAILGDADAIVIDRWMARVLDFRTKNKKTGEWQTSVGASEKQRDLLVAWVERGAKRMGISNRAYQALIWAGKKAIDESTAGRPTGTLAPLAEVIEQKVKLKGILAKDIPEGKESDYFILKGVDNWAIHLDSFLPLANLELFQRTISKKPKELDVSRQPSEVITATDQAEIDGQQAVMFAKMSKPDTAVEDSLDDIFGTTHKGILRKIKDGWKRFTLRTQILDEFHPILEHLGERTYKLHRMLNGVHASVEAFMRHGKLKLDADGAIVADGVRRGFAVWAKKHGKDAVNVLRWAAAKRSEQLERDNPEWVKNEEFLTEPRRQRIYKDIGAGPEGGGTWESLHAEFNEFHQSILDIAEKSGIIDSKTREDWGALIYVPFYRVFEDVNTREEFLANPKKAKDIAAKAKPIKGSKRKIGEPLENVIANWGYMLQESMRNQARAEAYVNGMLMNEIIDLVEDVDSKEITNTGIDKKGVITYTTKKNDENVLSFLDNGKRKYFKVNDGELYHALTTINAQHFGKLFNTFFGGPKRLLTYGATFGPAFRVANAVRDTLHTWMITPGMSFTPFLDTYKGFISSMREDEHYVAALASGGLHGGSYVHAEDPGSMRKFTSRLLGKEKDSIILDTGAKMLDFWDRLGAASENAARVQLHKNLVGKGAGTLEAGYQARDLLDFALKGQAKIVLALIRTIPFLGARAQGNYRLARAAFDPQTRGSMAIKGAILAAASLALWSAFKDDDRYIELEDYDKWTYYHWWIGDQHYRMPKPFEVGAIFSSAFESTANVMTDNEEIEFLGRFIKHTLTETFAIGVPQTVKPLAELWANKSFFTGRPIEGKAMLAIQPGERAEPWTSETLQLLGKGLNISPKKMEALARGYFATLSTFFLGGADQVARWVGDFPERPTYRSDDYPLIGRFWRQGPARNTKYATRLYEAMTESDMLVQTVRHYMIEGDMKTAEALADANLGKFTANKMLNRIRKKLTTLRRVMKDVERNTTLTREQKRKELDGLTVMRNGLVKEVYNIYKANL